MARRLQPVTIHQIAAIDAALFFLRGARNALAYADAPRAAAYVRRALRSAEGAARHARRRPRAC